MYVGEYLHRCLANLLAHRLQYTLINNGIYHLLFKVKCRALKTEVWTCFLKFASRWFQVWESRNVGVGIKVSPDRWHICPLENQVLSLHFWTSGILDPNLWVLMPVHSIHYKRLPWSSLWTLFRCLRHSIHYKSFCPGFSELFVPFSLG